ncbi:MAG: S53 family peptidase [Thermoplasmata archaeon]
MNFARRTFRSRPLALSVLIALLLAVPGVSGAVSQPAPSHTPGSALSVPLDAASVYSGSFVERAGYEAGYDASVSNAVPASGTQLITITFRPSDPSFFAPPSTGALPLSLAQIANRFGLSPAAYASAEAYFESKGLNVVYPSPDRLSFAVTGPVSAVQRAFGTPIDSGTYQGRAVTFPVSPPSLPLPLESSVSSVLGLSSGFTSYVLPAGLPSPSFSPATGPAADPDLITPAIARQIYDLSDLYNRTGSSAWATGQGIALILWGDGYAPSDLSTFFSNGYPSSFPQPNIQPYPVDGAPPPSNNAVNDPSKAPQELTLDMEWSGSMAPGATLDAVYAPDGPMADGYSPTDASMEVALNKAVTGISGVSVISMSFGTPENASGALQSAWATDFATAAQEGITLLAATGDLGGDAAANCQGGPSMDYPASSPDVIAVGGTNPTLARNVLGQVTGIQSESAWSGSSGGFSRVFPAPSWQEVGSAAAPIEAGGGRGTPDVSAAATYNYLYYNGTDGVAAGTSFATPLWGGLVAEMDSIYGAKLGFLTPRLYAVGASQEAGKSLTGLADVSSGSTCVGTAGPGWDAETGWGSPRALDLFEDLTATFVNLTISATPSPVAPGGTVTVTAELSNRTNGAPIAGVAVLVSLQASDPNGPCAGVWGSGNVTSSATGSVSLSVSVPACYFGSHGTAEVSVTSQGLYGTNSTTVDVNLLGFVPGLAGIEDFPLNVIAFAVIMGAAIAIGYVIGRPAGRPRGRPRPPGPPTYRPAAVPAGAALSPPPSPPPPAAPPPPASGPPSN